MGSVTDTMIVAQAKRRSRGRRALRFALRWTLRVVAAVFVLALLGFLISFRGALYNRFVRFPAEARVWASFAANRVEIAPPAGWQEYRGVLHSHSHFSHDSEVTFPEILAAAKEADIDFIFLSDHCVDGKADFSIQWRGLHEGVLFAPGFEMAHGFMPFGLPSDVVLDCRMDPEALAEAIDAAGGLLFFAHSEEERMWDLPQLIGMEIYNIHTDFKGEGFGELMPDLLLSLSAYPDHVLRLVFDRQDAILAHWDELNRERRIVGIAASDAHQNNGFRGYYTERDSLLLRMTSPDDVGEYDLNFLTRALLRWAFGPLEPGRQLFRIDLDPYARSLRFVNTHILARDLAEQSLLESLEQGRAFIAFDMLADARGFSVVVRTAAAEGTLGDTVQLDAETALIGRAPNECRFTVLRDGVVAGQFTGREFRMPLTQPGDYRVEAELNVRNRWDPWVYTNGIAVVE